MSEVTAISFAQLARLPLAQKKALVDQFGSIEKAIESRGSDGLGPLDLKKAEKEFFLIQKLGGWVLPYGSPNYPRRLSEISDPPMVLMGVGEFPKDETRYLSIVGPRSPSSYGLRIAKWLARDLAKEGLVLVSGLARGIDAVGHEAAIAEKKPTVAVLPCGIDRVYPPEHAHLKKKIENCGAVVTEFFCGEASKKENFPRRNRIISGLSKALLIIEGEEKSGTSLTTRHAIDQARDIYAVPGPVDSPMSFLPNRLIGEGAKLISSSEDVLMEFFPHRTHPVRDPKNVVSYELSIEEEQLLYFLELDRPIGVDDLVHRGKLSTGMVLQTLVTLEMKGIVAKQADARYVRVIA